MAKRKEDNARKYHHLVEQLAVRCREGVQNDQQRSSKVLSSYVRHMAAIVDSHRSPEQRPTAKLIIQTTKIVSEGSSLILN